MAGLVGYDAPSVRLPPPYQREVLLAIAETDDWWRLKNLQGDPLLRESATCEVSAAQAKRQFAEDAYRKAAANLKKATASLTEACGM